MGGRWRCGRRGRKPENRTGGINTAKQRTTCTMQHCTLQHYIAVTANSAHCNTANTAHCNNAKHWTMQHCKHCTTFTMRHCTSRAHRITQHHRTVFPAKEYLNIQLHSTTLQWAELVCTAKWCIAASYTALTAMGKNTHYEHARSLCQILPC